MKKIIYCFLPLIALQLNSCASGKAFSREAIPKDKEDPTVVTGFKNRIAYVDGILSAAASATYDNNKRPVVLNSLIASDNLGPFMASNNVTEYKYNEDGLLTYESVTTYAITGSISEIKNQNIRKLEYDKYKNMAKETNTHREYNGEEVDESVDISQTSYVYDENGNPTSCVEKHIDVDGEIKFKKTRDYTYDKKQRLINVEAKTWDNGDYDNPEGYSQIFKESHTYEGRKITDITETLDKTGGEFKTTKKATEICEYDSKYNLVHGLYYDYDIKEPLKSSTTEVFYEYNNKGLETSFKSYKTNSATSAISGFEDRITTYCGPNNDKLETRIDMKIQVAKFNDSNSDKSQIKSIRNYYDDKQRVIRQEISDESQSGKSPKPIQTTYLFEY